MTISIIKFLTEQIFDTRNQVALEKNKVSQDSMPFTVLSSDQETYWGKVPMWYFTPAWIDLRGDLCYLLLTVLSIFEN